MGVSNVEAPNDRCGRARIWDSRGDGQPVETALTK